MAVYFVYVVRLLHNTELLAPYEEELMAFERDAPQFGPLRRAVGIVIAEAIYCISDESGRAVEHPLPPADGEASRAR